MRRFNSYDELLEEIGVDFSSHIRYADDLLSDHLSNEGSDIVENENEEPISSFKLKIDNLTFNLGVTALEIDNGAKYVYYYWLVDTNLEGKQWKDIKNHLKSFISIDESNWNDECGIVDFSGAFSDYSITGYRQEDEYLIKDEETLYKNN